MIYFGWDVFFFFFFFFGGGGGFGGGFFGGGDFFGGGNFFLGGGIFCFTVQYSTVQYCTVQYRVQYSTVHTDRSSLHPKVGGVEKEKEKEEKLSI